MGMFCALLWQQADTSVVICILSLDYPVMLKGPCAFQTD